MIYKRRDLGIFADSIKVRDLGKQCKNALKEVKTFGIRRMLIWTRINPRFPFWLSISAYLYPQWTFQKNGLDIDHLITCFMKSQVLLMLTGEFIDMMNLKLKQALQVCAKQKLLTKAESVTVWYWVKWFIK